MSEPTDRLPLPRPPRRDYDVTAPPVTTTPPHWGWRIALGALSLPAAAGAFWLSIFIAFMSGGLDPYCTEDPNVFAIPWFAAGTTLGVVTWMAVASLLVTAIRGRGFARRTFNRVALIACVLGLATATAIMLTADWSQQVPSGGCLQMS